MDYKEFVASRKNYIGASDAPALMGVSPWKSKYQLWEDKLGLAPEQEDNWAMKRGRDLEPLACETYMLHTGNIVEPKMVIHPEIPYMMANFDGISEDHSVAVEIKCPGEKDHSVAKQGIVPEKYMPQLQHQMEVVGLEKLHYFSYRDGDTALIEVKRDESYIKKLLVEERKFWSCVENLTAPELSDKDYTKRVDLDWATAASDWKSINEEIEALKEKEKLYRETLLVLSDNKNCIGAGIRTQKIIRKGSVDYKAIPEMKDVDLEKYRKPNIESWRLAKC
jgi:putative phage-type endonuclease